MYPRPQGRNLGGVYHDAKSHGAAAMIPINRVQQSPSASIGSAAPAQQTSTNALQRALSQPGVYVAPSRLTPVQRAAGQHCNLIKVDEMNGGSHFPGWWNVVHKDVSLVIEVSSAHAGKDVIISGGWGGKRSFMELSKANRSGANIDWSKVGAAVVYKKSPAGFEDSAIIPATGKAGEMVNWFYIRGGENTQFSVSADGGTVSLGNLGQSADIGGDPHWRDVLVKIEPTAGLAGEAKGTKFVHHRRDSFNKAPHPNGHAGRVYDGNYLGGDANDAKAADAARTGKHDPLSYDLPINLKDPGKKTYA